MRALVGYAATAALAAFIWAAWAPAPARAMEQVVLSRGQEIYVPAYSHIYGGDRERPFLLAVTLSVRNTSLTETVMVTSIGYYDSEGGLLEKILKKPVAIKPFSSYRHVVKESDKAGGSGAKFLVRWKAGDSVPQPIVEAVMIGTSGQQGISFTSRGQVLRELD